MPILLLQDIIFSSVEIIPKNFSALKSLGYSLDDAKYIKTPVQRLPVKQWALVLTSLLLNARTQLKASF